MEVQQANPAPPPSSSSSSSSASGIASSPFVNQIVAPGDVVLDLKQLSFPTLRLGAGLRQDQDHILVTKAGRLKFTRPNKLWVEGSQKRYIPYGEDIVIGIVVDRRSECFIVDIGAPTLASLSIFAFEGATRRNVPNLQAGSVLYMRVLKALRDITPELSCVDATGKASGFGQLKDGLVFQCSTGLARALLSRPTCPVLESLGKGLSFEIAVGLNGRVWVNSASVSTVILVSNAIQNAEHLSAAQQKLMVQKLLQRLQ